MVLYVIYKAILMLMLCFEQAAEEATRRPATIGMTSGHRDPGAALPKPEVYHNPSYFLHICAELLGMSPVSVGLTPSLYTSHTCCTSPVPDTPYFSLHALIEMLFV
jgi:hypothetical protein